MNDLASAEDDIAAERQGGRGGGAGIPLLVFGILVVYPLSTGPAIKLARISGNTFNAFYSPLGILYRQCP